MARDELSGIFLRHKVISDSRTYEGMLDVRQFIYRSVYIQERFEILIEILADCGLQTGRSGTSFAEGGIFSLHAVHIRRRTSEVRNDTMPVGQLTKSLYLSEYRSLGP